MSLLLAPLLLLLLVVATAGSASAHAVLRASDPQDGAVLSTAPRFVTLTFTESVGLLDDSLRIFGPDGRRVHTGGARHAGGRADTVRVTLPERLDVNRAEQGGSSGASGTFTVAWRAVSADSHPVSGAFTFSIGKPSAMPAPVNTGPVEDPVTGTLYDVARYLAYVAVALLIGTGAFVVLCRPPEPGALRTPFMAGWWALLASTVGLLVLRAPYETGDGPATAFTFSAASRTLTGRPGVVLLVRLALLAATAVLVRSAVHCKGVGRTGGKATLPPGPVSRAAGLTGLALAVALSLTWATAGHASAGVQVPLAMASTVLHLLGMAVWMGGLVALLTMLNRQSEQGSPTAETIARFSRVAFAAVTVLVVTGVYQSWRGLGSWPALTGTAYGRILVVKTSVVILLLVAASYSRRWTARWASGGAAARAERCAEGCAEGEEEKGGRVGRATDMARVGKPVVATSLTRERARSARTLTHHVVLDVDPSADPDLDPGADPGVGPPQPGAGRSAPGILQNPRALRRSVLAEVALGVAVLVITTVLTGAEPGRAQAAAKVAAASAPAAAGPGALVTSVPFDVGTANGHGTVQITLEPGRVGENTVQAVVFGPDGGLATVPELRLTFALPARDLGPIDAKLADEGGYWGTANLNLPMTGTWTMRTTVRISDLDEVSVTKRVTITG